MAWQIGIVFGIPVRIHVTFVLLLVWFGWRSSQAGNDLGLSLLFLILVFGCVVLHELGHALTARGFGVRTREIVLYPIGGLARLERMPHGWAELLIALAGPAVNVVLAGLLVVLIVALPGVGPDTSPTLLRADQLPARMLWVNLALVVFNLIPAFPMDGGRVLRGALALALPAERATTIATRIGQGFAILFALVGLLLPNPLLVLIAAFVFLAASQEAISSRTDTAIRGHSAADAMITRFESVAPQDSLGSVADRLLSSHQQDFPVVDAWDRVVGVLPRGTLFAALGRHGREAAVLEAMQRDVPRVERDTGLEGVLGVLRGAPGCPVMVVDGERVVGMITLDNLTEFIEIARRTA